MTIFGCFMLLQTCEETRCPSIFPSFFPFFPLLEPQAMGWAGYLGSDSSDRPSQVAEAAVQLGLGAREIEDTNGWAVWWHSSHHHLGVSSSSWENFWVESMGISWLKIGRCSGSSWEYGGFQLVMGVPHFPPWIMDGFCERDNSI